MWEWISQQLNQEIPIGICFVVLIGYSLWVSAKLGSIQGKIARLSEGLKQAYESTAVIIEACEAPTATGRASRQPVFSTHFIHCVQSNWIYAILQVLQRDDPKDLNDLISINEAVRKEFAQIASSEKLDNTAMMN